MTELKKVLESKTKVRFHDCDPFNHLNNSRYIDYIMSARTDQLSDHYDFDIYRIAREQGVGWVSVQTQISYLRPAFLAEEVVIQTQLLEMGEKRLLFEAQMWDSGKKHLKAVLWGRLAHVNLSSQRSQEHSAEMMQFFVKVLNPLEAEMNFEERVKNLKTGL